MDVLTRTATDAARDAVFHLRMARDRLIEAGASRRCVDRVRAALSSAKGAERAAGYAGRARKLEAKGERT